MLPNLRMGISDVRDVAKAHLLALEKPEAVNQRFICAGEMHWFPEISVIFSEAKPELKIPTRTMPSWLVRVASLCSPAMNRTKAGLDKNYIVDASLIRDKETVADMMDDFIKIGAVPDSKENSGKGSR